MVEDDDLGRVLHALESRSALRVGQHQLAFAQVDSVGEFLARPPAVEQGGAAARHQDAHVGDDPVDRIARRDAHAVALLDAVLRRKAVRHMARGVPDLAEGHAHIAIDEEGLVLLLVAEMGEEMREAGGCVLEGGHGDAAARRLGQFEHLARRGHGVGNAVDVLVEFGGHGGQGPLSKRRTAPIRGSRRNCGSTQAFPKTPAMPKAAADGSSDAALHMSLRG